MKLRTSFCKGVALKKNIFRFAPIWALYLIALVMCLLEVVSYSFYDYLGRNLDDLIKAFGVVNVIYAGAVGLLLFGDLYNTKMCYSLHAMPIRRESWLLTHVLTGLLFAAVPNLVAMVLLMSRLEAYWFLALYWYLAVMLQYLFCFGIAVLSAHLTGSRFAMLAVYALLHFVSMLLYATVETIYIPMMTGVVVNMDAFSRFSPVVQLFRYDYFTFTSSQIMINQELGIYDPRTFYEYQGLADGWGYQTIIALVGVAAMGVGLWLYRIRDLESAGDFVAFPKLKGVVCVILTVCVSLCCALLGTAFGSEYVLWLAVGLAIGFFGSLMLLERRLKVFRKKSFLAFGVMVAAVVLSLLAIEGDWLGLESWTPKADRVESVIVANYRKNDYYNGSGGSDIFTEVTDPEQIQALIDAHQEILGRLGEETENTYRVVLTYKMKSGRVVMRSYRAPVGGKSYATIRNILYSSENILGFTDWQTAASGVNYMHADYSPVPEALHGALLQALYNDCKNGYVMTEAKANHSVEYSIVAPDGTYTWRYLAVMDGAEETLALLRAPEMAMGYSDWEEFLTQVPSVTVQDTPIAAAYKDALLLAIRKDLEAGYLKPDVSTSSGIYVFYEIRSTHGEYTYREFCITESAKNTWALLLEMPI